ncbi:extracellular solute-binding protein [Patescibacteria group bacterium]|nr:extracellular solute-binding protein [Patescibacteria group bacterium]
MKRLLKPISVLALLALLVTTGQGCTGSGSGNIEPKEVSLSIWRVFDDEDSFDSIITTYRAMHPNVKIEYRELRYSEYESELLQALAEGRGPDIFSVHNTWMGKYQSLLSPMPTSVTITQQEVRGSIRKQTIVTEVEKPTMTTRELESLFVEQVVSDAVMDYQPDTKQEAQSRIYGLPMAMDTLAMFYNKDLFDAAGIATPPKTWTEFQQAVILLTKYNEAGNVTASGVGMGLSENVERSSDMLSLLMMQNGTQMTDERGRITFQDVPEGSVNDASPGIDAVRFYTDFANPTKEVYTWNDSYDSAFEAFANGQTAMLLGYSYYTPIIRTMAPKLNFDVAPIPQIAGGRQVNYANYWLEGVSKSSENKNWAWDFILFATSENQVMSYLDSTNKPTALRNLIGSQLDNDYVSIFAQQALTAESWYHGKDATAMEEAFKDLITEILTSSEEPEDIIKRASQKVSQTF